MILKDILAIGGYSGLYKYLSQSRNGIIVESLTDGKKVNAPATAKISALSDIAIYTEEEEMPLSKIYDTIFAKEEGKQTISHKASANELKAFFEEILPDYDKDRVYVSDIKKVVSWYNTLQALDMLIEGEEAVKGEEENTEE